MCRKAYQSHANESTMRAATKASAAARAQPQYFNLTKA